VSTLKEEIQSEYGIDKRHQQVFRHEEEQTVDAKEEASQVPLEDTHKFIEQCSVLLLVEKPPIRLSVRIHRVPSGDFPNGTTGLVEIFPERSPAECIMVKPMTPLKEVFALLMNAHRLHPACIQSFQFNGNDVSENETAESLNMPWQTTMELIHKPHATIVINVLMEDGEQIYFKIRLSTRMRKVFFALCQRRGIEYESTSFTFKGTPISGNDIPHSVIGLEDQSQIVCLQHQHQHQESQPQPHNIVTSVPVLGDGLEGITYKSSVCVFACCAIVSEADV
jgi:hypothetical protein